MGAWHREPNDGKLTRYPCRWIADDADHSDRALGPARHTHVGQSDVGGRHGVDRGGKHCVDGPVVAGTSTCFTDSTDLETILDVLKATVKQVCMDLWENYASAVVVALPPGPGGGESVLCRGPIPQHRGRVTPGRIPSAQRRSAARSRSVHRRVATPAPPGMAIPESRPAVASGGAVRANPGSGQCLRAAHAVDGDLRSQPGSGDCSDPTPALGRTDPGVRPELFRQIYQHLVTLAGRDSQLFRGRAYQRFRRRAQQQTQAAQTLLLRSG